MGILLMIIGYGWSAFGLLNFITCLLNDITNDTTVFIILFTYNIIIFGPGLLIGALGTLINKLSSNKKHETKSQKRKIIMGFRKVKKRINELLNIKDVDKC